MRILYKQRESEDFLNSHGFKKKIVLYQTLSLFTITFDDDELTLQSANQIDL